MCAYRSKRRTIKEITEYLDEAYTRVAWQRTIFSLNNALNGKDLVPPHSDMTQEEWTAHHIELLERGFERLRSKGIIGVVGNYPDDPMDGFSYEYWEGVMGALRWVLGDEKNFLDT